MIRDDLENSGQDGNYKRFQSSINKEESAEIMQDREVPLGDGYDNMWRMINRETEIMGRRKAPSRMQARILAALPDDLYSPKEDYDSPSAVRRFGVVGVLFRRLFTRTQSRPSDLA